MRRLYPLALTPQRMPLEDRGPAAIFKAMPRLARCLLSALIALAVVFGSARESAARPAAVHVAMAGMACAMGTHAGHATTDAPCKAVKGCCCKMMTAAGAALPARLIDGSPCLRLDGVAWWFAARIIPGLCRAPEPLPPRTA